MGNQVEVQMFGGSGWRLDETPGQPPSVRSRHTAEKLVIEKRFEFDHHTMTMSVIVRDAKNNVHVFCKGAPEKVGAVCAPSDLPADFDSVSRKHAMEGCYVIGLAHVELGPMSEQDVAQLTREQVEKSGTLTFLGLMLFRNELKPDTTAAIKMIIAGDVRPVGWPSCFVLRALLLPAYFVIAASTKRSENNVTMAILLLCAQVMVTGDNAQCGYYIAKECGLVSPGTQIFLSEVTNGEITWKDMTTDVPNGGEPLRLPTAQILDRCKTSKNSGNPTELAITGKAMSILTSRGQCEDFLLVTRIFARVQPDQKVQVKTGFCLQNSFTQRSTISVLFVDVST